MASKRILLVDDEPEFRGIHALALRRAGYDVVEAANGMDAVQAAHEQLSDLILLDLRLPGMQGTDAVDLIWPGEHTAHLPVIALSAYGLPEAAGGQARAAGVDAYLENPVEPGRVVEVVGGGWGPRREAG